MSNRKAQAPTHLVMTKPDDWHVHLRDGAMLKMAVADTARHFARAIVMPNLDPPVTTTALAIGYRERIIAALAPGVRFAPLMTLYLTEATPLEEIARAKASGVVHGVKYYPANATTNAHHGVADLRRCMGVFEAMQRADLPLLLHGEVTNSDIDVFDREAVFIDRHLTPLVREFPQLRIVFEHITTRNGAQFVSDAPATIAATVTAHHLLLNRNAMFSGGLRPHHYCLPVLKREVHRQALIAAVTSGSQKFFLGTDSAPHLRDAKESACGCAGIYTAHTALELYAEAFEDAGRLDQLEGFASINGAAFYRLPRNQETVTLERADWTVPAQFEINGAALIPFRADSPLRWRMSDQANNAA